MSATPRDIRRFGSFELDIESAELRRHGRRVRLQPQPFKLLSLLTDRPGSLIGRDEIRRQLWPDGTFVDFDQSVSFAIKQIRDALGDSAARPTYLETVPRQGYRFIAVVDRGEPIATTADVTPQPRPTTVRLQKAMWANIAELRMAEARQRRLTYITIALLLSLLAVLLYILLR